VSRLTTTVGLCTAALLASHVVHAEPLLLTLEADFVLPLTAPQTERFGPGAAFAAGVLLPVQPYLLIGGRGRVGFLADGEAPQDPGLRDPGLGGYVDLHGVVRLRLPGAASDPRRAVGPFVEGGGGATITGELVRGSFEAGLGWGLPVGKVALAPRSLRNINSNSLNQFRLILPLHNLLGMRDSLAIHSRLVRKSEEDKLRNERPKQG
jgi:hypothetical protein